MSRRRPSRPVPDAGGKLPPPASVAPVWDAPRVVTAALVVAFGLALRLWHVGYGLPDFLDEAIPFKTALKMWGPRTDWNPHFFNYPSLTIYLSLLLQKTCFAFGHLFGRSAADFWLDYEIDPSGVVLPARILGVAFDALTLACVALIGERLRPWTGVIAAALVAIAPTMIVTARAIYTDTSMA